MANASYDTLTITINADSKSANQSINALSKNLQKLDDTAKNIDLDRINEVKGLLLDIANIDFSNVGKGLQDVVSAFKSFQSKAFMKATNGGTTLTPVDPEKVALAGETPDVSKIEEEIKPIAEIVDDVKEKVEESKEAVEETSKSVKGLTKNTKELGKAGNKSAKTIALQFKNILKYRVIRKLIQEIYKSFSDGLTNIATFDKDTAEALAQIKASLGYITSTIGSVLAPALQMLQPLITEIADGVAEAGNILGEVFATLNGQTQFAKAKKDVDAYRNSLLKTQALGIDELNVLQQSEASFEIVDIEQVDNVNGIKEAIGELSAFIKRIFEKMKPLTEKLLPQIMKIAEVVFSIIEAIYPIVEIIVDLVNEFVDETCENINGFIVDLLSFIKEIVVGIKNIFVVIQPILDVLLDVVATILNGIIGNLRPILQVLATVTEKLNVIFDITSPIVDLLSVISSYMGDIFGDVQGFAEPLIFVADILKNVLSPVFSKIKDFVSFIKNALEQWLAPVKKVIELLKNFIGGGINSVFNSVGNFFGGIGNTIAGWFSNLFGGAFAVGGFPEDGLFFANHTELVGKFANGQTAVANNEQIIEGIKRGVMEAMQQSGGTNVSVYLDSREITARVNENNDNRGATIVTGGKLVYGK